MRKIHILLFVIFLAIATATDSYYTKVIHNTDPDAMCLDGSPPMIYLHEGGDTTNIMFYFVGGASCLGTTMDALLKDCYTRSQSILGSSNFYPDYMPADGMGFLETDPQKSAFANWTKIILVYCDGAIHQGYNKNPVQYNGSNIYFRGALNTRSHFKYADLKYNLSNTQRIVMSGSSAGGMAASAWLSYVKGMVPDPERVYAVIDSGIIYNPLVQNWSNELNTILSGLANVPTLQYLQYGLAVLMPLLMSVSNVDESPPNKQCTNFVPANLQWTCLFIQYSYPTIQSKMLFVESSYDHYVMSNFLPFKCLAFGNSGFTASNCSAVQQRAVQLYRNFYLRKLLTKLYRRGHSFWSISCSWHAEMINTTIYDSPQQQVPMNSGNTVRKAVESFVLQNKKISQIDLLSWPANTPCAY